MAVVQMVMLSLHDTVNFSFELKHNANLTKKMHTNLSLTFIYTLNEAFY